MAPYLSLVRGWALLLSPLVETRLGNEAKTKWWLVVTLQFH